MHIHKKAQNSHFPRPLKDVNLDDYVLIWVFFKLFCTALIWASSKDHTEIVRLLLAHKEINVNEKDVHLFSSKFISII